MFALGLMVASCALGHLRIVPGMWRMTARAPTGPLHYSACLRSRHFAAQVLSHEGQHCRLSGPIQIDGAHVTIREACRVVVVSGQRAVRMNLTAHIQVGADGRQFTGRAHVFLVTPLGTVTEHQTLSGVRTGVCPAR